MIYKCEKCDKIFNHKNHYSTHVNKKYPCNKSYISPPSSTKTPQSGQNVPPISTKNRGKKLDDGKKPPTIRKEARCVHCFSVFSRVDGLKRHLDGRCKTKNDHDKARIDKDEELRTEFLKGVEEYKEQLKEEMDGLRKLLMKQFSDQQQITGQVPNLINNSIDVADSNVINGSNNITGNTINNVANNVNMIPFGQEDLSKIITDKQCEALFRRGLSAISELVKEVHCNAKYPEYANCCVTNMRDNKAKCFNGKSWDLMSIEECIQIMIDNKQLFLENKFDALQLILSKMAISQFNKFIKQKDSPELYIRYKEVIKQDLYNSNHIALNNQKITKNGANRSVMPNVETQAIGDVGAKKN